MKDHTGKKRQFIQISRAWYASVSLPQDEKIEVVMIGFYDSNGGTTGEFQVSWEYLGDKLVPCLSAFDDAWNALLHFNDLLKALADIDGENISPDEFCRLLVNLGIEDATPTQIPH